MPVLDLMCMVLLHLPGAAFGKQETTDSRCTAAAARVIV